MTSIDIKSKILEIISNLSKEDALSTLREIEKELVSSISKNFTIEDVENKNYTFVCVETNEANDESDTTFEKFIVSSPYKEAALILAKQYVKQQGWELKKMSISPYKSTYYHLYPRKYRPRARELFEQGKYI